MELPNSLEVHGAAVGKSKVQPSKNRPLPFADPSSCKGFDTVNCVQGNNETLTVLRFATH